MHYKAPDNSLHCIEPDFAYLLPAGCVAITDEEAEVMRPKPEPIDPAIEALAYLASTDWYVTRFIETGKPIPDDVSKKREEARKQAN